MGWSPGSRGASPGHPHKEGSGALLPPDTWQSLPSTPAPRSWKLKGFRFDSVLNPLPGSPSALTQDRQTDRHRCAPGLGEARLTVPVRRWRCAASRSHRSPWGKDGVPTDSLSPRAEGGRGAHVTGRLGQVSAPLGTSVSSPLQRGHQEVTRVGEDAEKREPARIVGNVNWCGRKESSWRPFKN